MSRAGFLLEIIAATANLELAFWKAARGKRHGRAVELFGRRLETELSRLRRQILSGDVDVGAYRTFRVFEPKERRICAPAFAEQVLHHALMNVCHPLFERAQVFDSYASRKGKGQYRAIERARLFSKRHGWFLKLDIRKFFESVHHDRLKGQLERLFKDPGLLQIFSKIIDSYEASPGRGLPIGCLTSQYFANHALAPLDHFIKEKLRVKAYVRYMDDMVLWHDDKSFLKDAQCQIAAFLAEHCQLALKPALLNRTRLGLPFLGYRVFADRLLLMRQSKRRFFKKMAAIDDRFHSGEWGEAQCQRHALPLLAFVEKADSLGLRRRFFDPQNPGEKGRPP